MPDNTPAVDTAPASSEPNIATPTTPQTDASTSASASGDFDPSWFTALDNAFASEESGSTDPKPDDTKPAEEKSEDSEKKSEDPTDDSNDDETAKSMTPSAGAKFKEIKAEAKAARARVAELEAKLAEVEIAPKPDQVEAEKLQSAIAEKEAKLVEYEKELAISRFEATEEYKESVVAPMAAILGVVEDLAKEYEISEKSLLGILEETNRKAQEKLILELASNFSERDRITLYNLGDDYAAVMDHKTTRVCRALDGMVAPKGDPVWMRFSPPNHFGCRSALVEVWKSDLLKEPTIIEPKASVDELMQFAADKAKFRSYL